MSGIFGTDGVRCDANLPPLVGNGPAEISAAALTYLAEPGDTALIAFDPRESAARIVDSLAAGAERVGVHVEVIGQMPTPGLAFSVWEGAARDPSIRAGFMVTASHCKVPDNGVKTFTAANGKLSDAAQHAIEGIYQAGTPARGERGLCYESGVWAKRYGEFLIASAEGADFSGLRVGIDPGNGAASGIAEWVFGELGAEVLPINNRPDGWNINVASGATDTAALREHVVEHNLDVGIALDGDADRVELADDRGRAFNGDRILHLLGVAGGHDTVVATVMTNLGAERAMQDAGIKLIRTDVGDRYVLEGMQEHGADLGGEQSGHIIQRSKLATGDGMLAAISAVRAARESGLSLSQWRDRVQMVPQELVNIKVPDKAFADDPAAREAEARLQQRLGTSGRTLMRKSGTEQVIRVMVESPRADVDARALAQEIYDLAWARAS